MSEFSPQIVIPGNEAAAEQQEAPDVTVTRGLRDWLLAMQVSLAFTTYQHGRLILLGVGPDGRLSVGKQDYRRAMGLHYENGTLHLASAFQVWRLENMLDPGQYANAAFDSVLVPRVAHTTGYVDAHDLSVDRAGRVVFVNTSFSCLATLDERFSFRPVWKPDFISGLYPQDRCHLNGLAMEDGAPAYVTVVDRTDAERGWREGTRQNGVVIDVRTNQVLCDGFAMPHSPRIHDGYLWVQDSARGFIVRIDPATGAKENVVFCPGFLRGMAFHGKYAIATMSMARHGHFGEMQLQRELDQRGEEAWCGVVIVDLERGAIVECLRVKGGFSEMFDVVVMPGVRNPMSIGPVSEEIVRNVRFNPEFAPLDPAETA